MNLNKNFLFVAIMISVLLLSGCEVYQTLYGTPAKEQVAQSTKVIRVEGQEAQNPSNLAATLYASSEATMHDPFKIGQNPLGPFPKGNSLGFTLQQWLDASGIGIYSADGENAQLELSLQKLVPNGVYTVWCSRLKMPPEPMIEDFPCGAANGSENMFKSDSQGNAAFNLKLKTLPLSTNETSEVLAIAYHSDGQSHGASPGEFGMNSHVQLFFMIPEQAGNKYQVPLKFANHISAGFPEQDVFIEMKEPSTPTGAATEEQPKETEEVMEEKPQMPVKETPKESEVPENSMEENPFVISVDETEKVSLSPSAEDPDTNTNLIFTFTSPLDEKGEWQTTYGDSGEYTVTITASDGESTTSREALVIVKKKDEVPTIDISKPIESGLVIDETQAIEFSVEASDLNKDALTYGWKVDGSDVGIDKSYAYQSTYEDAGTHTVKVDVSDGLSSASKIWSVDVKNVNRKPVLEKIDDVTVKETNAVVITALATDDDKDAITYSISDKRFDLEDNVFTWKTDYNSSGTFEVKISASDGQDITEQTFNVIVENVNRPPVITDIVQKK